MKSFSVIFTPRAERQLNDLYEYISDNSGEVRAEKYVGGIITDCLALSTFPNRGTKRDDIRPNLRTKGYAKRVTMAFSVNDVTNIVVIHGVFYGGQNFEPLLHEAKSDD